MNSQPLSYGVPTGNDPIGFKTTSLDETTRYKFLRISNQERSSGSPNAFTVNLGNDPLLDRCVMLQIVSASIPNSGYNISGAIGNNTFTITWPAQTPVSVVLIDGFYTAAGIITLLNTAVVPPATYTFVMAQDPNSRRLYITSNNPFTVQGSPSYPNTSSLMSYLGWTQPSVLNAVSFADTVPSLQGDTVFYIHSPTLSLNMTYLDTRETEGLLFDVNSLLMIPITVPYGVYQSYQGTTQDKLIFGRKGRSVRNFDIILRTNHGRLLALSENQEAVITFKMFYDITAR